MSNHECPCCSWHLINGVCGACGQVVETKEFASHSPAPQCGKSMCEVCGTQAAESGDFICMECISRMLLDME